MRYVPISRRRRRGTVLVQVVMWWTCLFGLLAVVLDGGLLLAERRHAQATADAAALAAAADLFANYRIGGGAEASSTGTAHTSAKTTAAANGYTAGNSTITVRVSGDTPGTYLGGPNAGNPLPAGYAEVTVTYNQARFFSSIWGAAKIPVSARAVARGEWAQGTTTYPGNLSFLVLAASGTSVTGNGGGGSSDLTLAGGSFTVNSTGPNAFDLNGHPSITAAVFNLASTQANSGNPSSNLYGPGGTAPTINYSQTPTADPLASLQSGLQSLSSSLPVQSSSGTTLNPGVYNSGINVSGNVTMNPGIYYLNGPLSASGTLDGTSGVLIYFSSSAGNSPFAPANVSLNPINTGTYKGISVFVNSNLSGTMDLGGNSTSNIYGALYAPGLQWYEHGTPVGNLGSQVIVNTSKFSGNASAGVGLGPKAGQATAFQLVE